MRELCPRSRRCLAALSAALLAVVSLQGNVLAAAPRRPRPRPRKPRVRPHPPKRLRPGVRPRLRPRPVRAPRFWHPYYRAKPRRVIWVHLGYPYYEGGTHYVSAASENTQASSHVAQIQELVDLVHQWRTMNESPEVHKRLASAQEAEEQGQTIEAIRGKNEDFDQVTRRAMAELSEGRSAEEQIASARSLLAELMKLVESLPEG